MDTLDTKINRPAPFNPESAYGMFAIYFISKVVQIQLHIYKLSTFYKLNIFRRNYLQNSIRCIDNKTI